MARPAMLAASVVRTFGWRGLTRRLRHEWRARTNGFRRAPARGGAPLGDATSVFAPHAGFASMPTGWRGEAVHRGERVRKGSYEAYGWDWRPLPVTDAEWTRDPVTGFRFADDPWWRIETLPPSADIKDVWEPARFTWVYDLIRAHAITGEPAYARAFFERLEGWMAANPPFCGVHWACGQETAVRAMAILHGVDAFAGAASAWPGADRATATALAWSGERIADGIDYGASQRNNHGISEAAALVHLGLRFGRSHPAAAGWYRRGMRVLTEQILDQFADDGWYAQHSFTYLRVALEQVALAQRALRASGRSLPDVALDRVARGVELLLEVTDASTGVAPNHGSNDGALVTRYSLAAYRDMRPVLTLACVVFGLAYPEDLDTDDAVLAWLGMEPPESRPPRGDGVATGPSGWASARLGPTHVFLRAGTYRHRPSHLDRLHVDVRHAGNEIIVDAGTFAYNRPPAWRNAMAAADLHNGPLVDGSAAGERGPRFLWYAWPAARLRVARHEGDRILLEADAPEGVCRRVIVTREAVRVEDTTHPTSPRALSVNWLLAPGVPEGVLDIECSTATVLHGSEAAPAGWFSPSYGKRIATTSVQAHSVGPRARIATTVTWPERRPGSREEMTHA